MRPVLRPGLRPLRRDPRTLQLGLDWAGTALIGDTPAVAAVLSSLDGFHQVEGVLSAAEARGVPRAAARAALDALVACGAVVDADRLAAPDVAPPTWAAWSLLAGPTGTAHDVAAARAACTVGVLGEGLVADAVRALLPRARVRLADAWSEASVVIAASDHEPDRDRSDDLMHLAVPHLWAHTRDVVGVLGPFVDPGVDACLRCVDASRSDVDRCWPTLLAADHAHRAGPPVADPVLATLVAAWAVHETAVLASGLRPQTAGSVLELAYGGGPVTRVGFEPHPACGCGWPTWQDTMGA